MNKSFFKTYFREICFVVVMVLLTSFMIGSAWGTETINGSVYSTLWLAVFTLFFCSGVYLAARHMQTSQEIENLKLTSAFAALALFGSLMVFSCHIQQQFAATDLIHLGCCGIVCAFFCGWYLDARTRELRDLEFLKETRPDQYLRALIERKSPLTVDQQLKIFHLHDAEQLLFQFMQYDDLCESGEVKLMEQPYALSLIKHLPRYSFTNAADARMFVQPNAAELVLQYVENGNVFSDENALKMFELPNAPEVVDAYICNAELPEKGEKLMLELPNAADLVDFYDEEYGFCDEAAKLAEEKGLM